MNQITQQPITLHRKLCLLFLSPSCSPSGARVSLLYLLLALKKELTPLVVLPQNEGIFHDLKRMGVRCTLLHVHSWRKGKNLLGRYLTRWKLRRLLHKEQPDLIHCNEPYAFPFVNRLGKVPIISHVRLPLGKDMVRKYQLQNADCLIVVSSYLENQVKEAGYQGDTRVLYNCLDTEEFSPGQSSRWRERLGLTDGDFIIGLLGNYEPRKAQDLVIQAAHQIAPREPRIFFLFAGRVRREYAPYLEQLKQSIEALGLKQRCFILPFQKEVRELYATLDLNLLVSRQEGFGRSVIEASAMGIPSIGTRVGGISELIRDGETGFLIPEDERGMLVERILCLYHQPELRARMGIAARQMAVEHFSLEKFRHQLLAIYAELLSKRR